MKQNPARMPGIPQTLITFGLSISSLAVLLPTSPAWALAGGAGSLGAGATNAVLMAVTVATQFSVPTITRRFAWARVLPTGVLLLGLPSLIQLLSPDLPNILLTSALRGVGFGIVTVCCSSAMSYLVPLEYRGRAVGLYGFAAAGCQTFFTPLAPWAIETYGHRAVIAVGAVAALAAPFALDLGRMVDRYLVHHQMGESLVSASPQTSTATIIKRIWPALLTLTLVTSVGGALMTFSTEIAPTARLATGGLLLLCVLATPTRFFGGSLTDRFGTRLLMTPVLGLTALGLVLLALMDGANSLSVLFLLLGASIIGFGYGFLQSVTMVRALTDAGGVDTTQRASVAWNSHFDIGTGLGALAIGAVAQNTNFATAWAGAAIILALCALLIGLRDARWRSVTVQGANDGL